MKTYLMASLLTADLQRRLWQLRHPLRISPSWTRSAIAPWSNTRPSKVDGLKILGNKAGYPSIDDAKKALSPR